MPYRPPRACRCGAVVPSGQRCVRCYPPWANPSDEWSAGSTRRWRRVRAIKLGRDPLCEWAECVRVAADVDHITPLAEGGARYDLDNLQSLCTDHHKVKSAQDAARRRAQSSR